MIKQHLRCWLYAALALLLVGCERGDTPPPHKPVTVQAAQNGSLGSADLSLALWQHSSEQLQYIAQHCQQFKASVAQLLKAPATPTLQNAQQQWRQLHGELRQLSLPLAIATRNPGLFTPLAQTLANIDAHPIAPGYIDAVKGYPHSGLINDITLNIDHTTLRRQHRLTAPNEASLGLHPLEFVLFGEQGKRQANNFNQNQKSLPTHTAVNQPHQRRRDYLRLTATLLCDDLAALVEQWRKRQSAIAQPYFDLKPAARLQLWQLMLTLELDSLTQHPSQQHCDFAPNGCALRWRLEGLLSFIDAGASQALTLTRTQQQRWQSGVAQLRAALAEDTAYITPSTAALKQMADALSEQTRE
jgi:hypothetical protein